MDILAARNQEVEKLDQAFENIIPSYKVTE